MDPTMQLSSAVSRLGFWSALAVTLMLILFPLSLIFGSLDGAYLSSFLLAPAFVAMMVSIHHYAAAEQKVWSQLALSLAIIYAVLCSLTYYIQLTFLRNNYLPVADEAVLPFVFIPGTPIFAQDMLGYAFLCAATLAAAPVFTGGRLETWIRWLFLLNGLLFALPTLLLPALTMPTNAAGSGAGNLVGTYANIVWSLYAALAMGLVARLFLRAGRSGAAAIP